MAKLNVGQSLGHYEIVSLLGEGGMASVYRARQRNSNREVAIKVIKPELGEREEFVKRFEREAKTMAALSHPHILNVYEYAAQDDLVYLAMQLLTGGSLDRLIQQRAPLPPAEIERLLSQIASALQYAHAQGVIHRDLKPQNILLNAAGDAILTDFGLAKALHDASPLTRTGTILGTPGYMPPEQWRGETVDARTDVYALGIILFELLTGQLPFQSGEMLNVMHKHIYETPPAVSRWRPDAPSRLEWVIEKALAKHRDGRFQSADELAMAFRVVAKDDGAWRVSALKRGDHTGVSDPEGSSSLILISLELADEQERHALALLDAERQRRSSRLGTRFINPLPQDVHDKFKGRIKEQADILNLLRDKARLISIYGRGGVGKTALVCKVLTDLQATSDGDGHDGMVYLHASNTGISLDRIFTDFGKLVSEEAQAVLKSARSDPHMPPEQKVSALLEALQGGRYLLLLDNLETLQTADTGELTDPEVKAFIEGLLRQGGPLSVIVTSREPLPLPRDLKPQERLVPLEAGLHTEDAVAVLRASDPDGAAGLRDAPEPKLVKIAEKLRGFPRALEAAVGLLLEDSLLNLDDLLDVGRERGLLDSQITPLIVKQAIERLNPDAIRVLEALAMYELPVSQAALEFLLAPYADTSGLRVLLNRLVRSYFVSYNKAVQTFGLHPIDRDYCYARIPEGTSGDKPMPDTAPRYTRHALNYRAANFYERQRKPKEDWKSIADLEPQLAEFEHLLGANDANAAAGLLITFDQDDLMAWGHYGRVIALHERLQGRITDDSMAGQSYNHLGTAYLNTGRLREACSSFEQALAVARQIGDHISEGNSLHALGTAYEELGERERAIEFYQQALIIARQIGNRMSEAANLNALGAACEELGEVERAIEFYQQALAIARQISNPGREAAGLNNLGMAYCKLGEVERAIEFYQQALAICRENSHRRNEGNVLCEVGYAQAAIGQYTEAIQSLRLSLTIAEEINVPRLMSYSGGDLALALLLSGDLAAARQAIAAARMVNVPENNYKVATWQGVILARSGEREVANAAFHDALHHADDLLSKTPKLYQARYAHGLAQAGLAVVVGDDTQAAIDDYRAARALCAAAGLVADELRLLDALMACPGGEVLQPVRAVLAGEAS